MICHVTLLDNSFSRKIPSKAQSDEQLANRLLEKKTVLNCNSRSLSFNGTVFQLFIYILGIIFFLSLDTTISHLLV